MKEKKHLILWILSMFMAGFIYPQSMYIQVRDGQSYRGLPDVRVELKSENSSMTLFTSAEGEINTNLPPGKYSITASRSMYENTSITDVEVKVGKITPVEILMDRTETSTSRGKADTQRHIDSTNKEIDDKTTHNENEENRQSGPNQGESESWPISQITYPDKLFFDLGLHYGNFESVQLGIGYYYIPEAFLMVNFAHSRQSYMSALFNQPENQKQVIFNRINLNSGILWKVSMLKDIELHFNPNMNLGIEFAKNNDLIDNNKITALNSTGFTAAFEMGVKYSIAVFYVGATYAIWLYDVMNQDRMPLENGVDGTPVKWGNDLFPEREGTGIKAGIRIFIQ